MLKIYNTFSGKKEKFIINSKKINIYVCGVTVSDYCHIGHARTFCFFDILLRYLIYLGNKCCYIRNITDLSDNIIHRSYKKNICLKKFSNIMINNMNNDFRNIGLLKPDYEPRVSNYIKDIIISIEILIKKKNAFISKNGDVIFNINNIRNNINIFLKKNNYNNFVLWKLNINSKNIYLGWDSPWGKGRPGWHIGCSIMSNKYFNSIDIHGGGIDLLFPHHNNEYIISKCLFGRKYFVKYWLHTGMVLKNNKKLSKSNNNNFLIKNLLKIYKPDVIKYFIMSVHYRKNLFFSFSKLKQSELSIKKIYSSLRDLNLNIILSNKDLIYLKKFDYYFSLFMNDDFNIPKIYKLFFLMVHKINKLKFNNNYLLASKIGVKLKIFANIIGLFNDNNINFFNSYSKYKDFVFIKRINYLIYLRNKARNLKKWNVADWIRKKLLKLNIFLQDNLNFTDWYIN